MHSRKILLERAEKWLSPIYWTDVNIRSALYGDELCEVQNLSIFEPPGDQRPHVNEVLTRIADFLPAQVGEVYGPIWSTKWFHFDVEIPNGMHGLVVCLKWDSNSEAMIYSSEGTLLQSFTGGSGSDRRDIFIVSESAVSGDKRSYFVEMACNEMFGNGNGGMIKPPGPNKTFTLSTLQLVSINPDGQDLYWDMHVLYEMVKTLPENCPTAARALALMTQIINDTNLRSNPSIVASHALASEFFQGGIHSKVDHDVYAYGHCHIDTAWLWPYAETRRKVARSWVTQIGLLRRYPDYRFVASQTVQFEWLLQDHPEVIGDIKDLVQSQKFLPVGGTYVEFDAYMPSGEAMIRQFLYGFQFMKKHFDIKPKIFWLPDTFGYSSQLPQIMQGFGVEYFLSQKLSWNLLNVFPHSTFEWEGIDGSSVIAHFPPADNYSSGADPCDIMKSVANNKSKTTSNRSMLLFGHGDGGGGPAVSHLEKLSRMVSAPGLPRIHQRATPEEFFEQIEQDFLKSSSVNSFSVTQSRSIPHPVWVGELYLELHQGTLTSQSLIKKQNRQCEIQLRGLEAMHVLLMICGARNWVNEQHKKYCEELGSIITGLWKDTLLNQFHDVLPGSSIACVYEDSDRMLSNVLRSSSDHMTKVAAILTPLLDPPSSHSSIYWIFNTCPFDRTHSFSNGRGNSTDEDTAIKGFSFADIPPHIALSQEPSDALINVNSCRFAVDGVVTEDCSSTISSSVYLHTYGTIENVTSYVLGNSLIEASFSSSGAMESLVDKRTHPPRQLLQQPDKKRKGVCGSAQDSTEDGVSVGNHFVLYEDIPFYWDAWDVMPYHQMTGKSLNGANAMPTVTSRSRVVLLEEHAAKVECTLDNWGETGTTLTTTISLAANSALIEFDVAISWHEKHKLLKVEFPLAVRSPVARFETQFGHTERPTHTNQPTDAAMFETCGHKYADLSESGYGVALLNDCKYGYSCRGSTLCLSLLRAPKAPDENCDMGQHFIRYGIYPHIGSIQDVLTGREVVQAASLFNSPLLLGSAVASVPHMSLLPNELSMVRNLLVGGLCWLKHAGGLVIDSLKSAESNGTDDGPNHSEGGVGIIVRLYESIGSRGTAVLALNTSVLSVHRCNMAEDPLVELSLSLRNPAESSLYGLAVGSKEESDSGCITSPTNGAITTSGSKKKNSESSASTTSTSVVKEWGEVIVEYSPFEVITLRLRL